MSNATLGVTSELGWLAYTVHGGLWSAIPEAVLMVGTNVMLVAVLLGAGAAIGWPLVAAVVWAGVLAAATAADGVRLLGLLLPLAYAVQVVPSVWTAYRTRVPSGIAVTTWMVVLVEAVLWGTYGVVEADPALTIFAVVAATSSAAIVARVVATRHRITEPTPRAGPALAS
jgi:hypothetical protein